MRKLKKICSIITMLILVVGICGCGKSPSKVVSDYLDKVKTGENSSFSEMLNKSVKEESKKEDNESEKKVMESIKKVTYKINSETIDGNNAKVNVTVNGPDLAAVLAEYMKTALSDAFSEAFSGNSMSEEETNKHFEEILSKCMDNVKYTERTGDIELTKSDNGWELKDTNQLLKLIVNLDPDAFKNTDDSKENNAENKKIGEMVLNEPFLVQTEYGTYNITIEGARATDERNEFSDIQAGKVVYLDYNYENIDFGAKDGQDLYVDEYAFQVLDDDGNVLKTYPVYDENRTPQSAPVGGKCAASVAFAIPQDSNNLNVTFVRGINEKVAKIVVPIQ